MKKGDRVICINDAVDFDIYCEYTYWPLKGHEYIIRDKVMMENGFWGVRLEGIVNREWYNKKTDTWFEPVYVMERFVLKENAPKPTIDEINAELLVQNLLIEVGIKTEK